MSFLDEPFRLDSGAYDAWRRGADSDIASGLTANSGSNNSGYGFSSVWDSGLNFDYLTKGQYVGGSNPEGIGTKSDPNLSNKNPTFDSVIKGMMAGPDGGETGNTKSGTAGIETWLESWFIRLTVIILGFIFIATGLSMLGKNPISVGIAEGLKPIK